MIGRRAARRPAESAARWTRLDALLRHGVWFGCFLVLAQILGPAEYGGFILAASGILIVEAALGAIATRLLDGWGHGSDARLATGGVAVIAVGTALTAVLYAVAGIAAPMFDDSGVAAMFQSLSLLPLLRALAILPAAQLRAQERAGTLTASGSASSALGGAAALAAALAGAGSWALVVQVMVERFVAVTLLWIIARPRMPLRLHRSEVGGLARGVDLAAAFPGMARYAPPLIIVVTLGPVAAGLYFLADRLAAAFDEIGFAPLRAENLPGRTADCAGRAAGLAERAGFAAFPALLASAALVVVAIPAMTDPRWWGAIAPAQWLLLGIIAAPFSCLRTALLAEHAGEQGLRTVALIAAALVAAPSGLVAVAIASVGLGLLGALFDLCRVAARIGPGWAHVAACAAAPLAVAAATGAAALAVSAPIAAALPPFAATWVLIAGGAALFAALRALPHPDPALR